MRNRVKMSMPKYATARNPANPTTGAQVELVAQFLNTPLMPWQKLVAEVAGERHAEHPERARYQTVVVTVPRQSGKTTLIKALMAAVAQANPGCQVYYTAQTRKDAVEKWGELAKQVRKEMGMAPDGKPRVKVLEGTGNERIVFRGTESMIMPFAPTVEGIHGKTSPLVVVDEAWAFDQARGDDLMAAFNPVGLTIPHSQVWIISTAGDTRSEWLRSLIDKGRQSVNDPGTTTAFFEWSADEQLAATNLRSDEALAFHPAIGFTQELWKIKALAQNEPDHLYRRSYLNLWPTAAETSIVDLEAWEQLEDVEPKTMPPDVAIGFDVAAGRTGATVYAAWQEGENVHIHRLISKAGAAWVEKAITHLQETLAPMAVVADDSGNNRPIIEALRRSGNAVYALRPREYASANSEFFARISDGKIHHDGTSEIIDAFANAVMKPISGGQAISPRHSAGPVDTARAAIAAVYAALNFDSRPQIFL